ncbi:MAG: hypothetical protein J0G96_07810 [Flavobacteriia bacterium]|nr:hypothetical protein [Flavobacteriia bacterium]OJX39389.1 MAG: hypothetical protein BGO87_05290 [Flavobacteriia bacterium 40-80]
MKKMALIVGTISIIGIATSCKTTQVAKFASVEDVISLKPGITFNEAVSLLGSKPYNILSNQLDGYTIYAYQYKVIERQISSDISNRKGGETTGTEVYNKREQTAFLFFKNDKLESLITSQGRKDSYNLALLNNTLYVITKEKDKYVITPANESTGTSFWGSRKKKQ